MKPIQHTEAEILRMYTDAHDDQLPFGILDSAIPNMDTIACYVQTLTDGLRDQYADEDELANEVEDRLRQAVAENEGDLIEIAPYANIDRRWSELWQNADLLDESVLKVYSTENAAPWRNHWGREYTDAVNFMAWAVENWPDYEGFAQKYGIDPETQTQTTTQTAPEEGASTTVMAQQTKTLSEWFTRYTEMTLSNGYKPFAGKAEYTTEGRYALCTIKQDNYYEDEDGNIIDGFVRMRINIDKAPHKMECSQWIEDFRYDWSGAAKCAALWEIMTSRDATHEEMMAAMTPACAKRYAKVNGLEQTQTPQTPQPPSGGVEPTEPTPTATVPSVSPEGQQNNTTTQQQNNVASQPKTMPTCSLWWTGCMDDAFYAVVPTANEGEVQIRVYDMDEDKLHSVLTNKAEVFTAALEGSNYKQFEQIDTIRIDFKNVYADLLKEGIIAEVVKVETVMAEPTAQTEPIAEPTAEPEPEPIAEPVAVEQTEPSPVAISGGATDPDPIAEPTEPVAQPEPEPIADPEPKAVAATTATKKREMRHPMFGLIKSILESGENAYVWGAPGSGKTHMAAQLAEEFGLNFTGNGCIYQPYELLGYQDANGVYHPTAFVNTYRYGGLHNWDEFDRSIPSAVAAGNSAIANGFMDLPNGERIYKHPDFKLMATGNTNGEGPTEEFAAANRFEQSTLDRFTLVKVDYDEQVELSIAEGDKEMVQFIHDLRRACKECRYKMCISYRAIAKMVKFFKVMTPSDALKYALLGDMSYDNMRAITNNLRSTSEYMKFMKMCCDLKRQEDEAAAA